MPHKFLNHSDIHGGIHRQGMLTHWADLRRVGWYEHKLAILVSNKDMFIEISCFHHKGNGPIPQKGLIAGVEPIVIEKSRRPAATG